MSYIRQVSWRNVYMYLVLLGTQTPVIINERAQTTSKPSCVHIHV